MISDHVWHGARNNSACLRRLIVGGLPSSLRILVSAMRNEKVLRLLKRPQKLFSRIEMGVLFDIGHFIKASDQHTQPWILQKECAMRMHKPPE